jgi:hypothetical protein
MGTARSSVFLFMSGSSHDGAAGDTPSTLSRAATVARAARRHDRRDREYTTVLNSKLNDEVCSLEESSGKRS